MAVLTATKIGDRRHDGRYVKQTFRVTTGVAAADEWIATGFKQIVTVEGPFVHGAATSGINFVKNARGTGVAENTNAGDLGVEAAAAVVVEVTVVGFL